MSFEIKFTEEADRIYEELEQQAKKARSSRDTKSKTKSSKQEGLFKQLQKTLGYLAINPKHPFFILISMNHFEPPMTKENQFLKHMSKIIHLEHIESFGVMGRTRKK